MTETLQNSPLSLLVSGGDTSAEDSNGYVPFLWKYCKEILKEILYLIVGLICCWAYKCKNTVELCTNIVIAQPPPSANNNPFIIKREYLKFC